MSYETTCDYLGVLSSELENRYLADNPLYLTVNGKPKIHILSLQPLIYDKFGLFRNKAPYVAGDFALRGFLTKPHPKGGALVIACLQAENQTYGFIANGSNANSLSAINDVSAQLGHPEIEYSPAT